MCCKAWAINNAKSMTEKKMGALQNLSATAFSLCAGRRDINLSHKKKAFIFFGFLVDC